VLKFCVGKTFRVTGLGEHGLVGLDVSPEVDRKFGGFMHEVWVEPDCIAQDVPRLNGVPGRPAFRDVVHLAHGGSTMGHLTALGAKRVFGMMDSLTTGPASANPSRHAEVRNTYWREFYRSLPQPPGSRRLRHQKVRDTLSTAADLRVALRGRRPGQSVVLWAGTTWAEILFVWWACDALERCRVHASDVRIACRAGEFARYVSRPLYTPAHAADEEVLRLFSFSRRARPSLLRAGARLWSAFAKGDLGYIQTRRDSRLLDPPLEPIPRTAAYLIPQIHKSGGEFTIHLSRYDERLLGLFGPGEWSTAMERMKDPATQKSFMSLMEGYGDLLIPARLAQWASDVPEVLEKRPAANATSFLNAVEYRLSEKGRATLHANIDFKECPKIAIGGFVAYKRTMKWFTENLEGIWRFVAAPSRPGKHPRLRRKR
jgi:hypothetical protein